MADERATIGDPTDDVELGLQLASLPHPVQVAMMGAWYSLDGLPQEGLDGLWRMLKQLVDTAPADLAETYGDVTAALDWLRAIATAVSVERNKGGPSDG
jgi:hypothetical protein